MHQVEIILRAHLVDKKSTEASIGVIYSLLIAAEPALEGGDWGRVHIAIRNRFDRPDDSIWLKKLDRIKDHGWRLHKATQEAQTRFA